MTHPRCPAVQDKPLRQVRHSTPQVSCSTGQATTAGQALHTPGILQGRTSAGVHYGRSGTTHPRYPAVQDKHWCPLRQVRHYTHQVSCSTGQALVSITAGQALHTPGILQCRTSTGVHYSRSGTTHTRCPAVQDKHWCPLRQVRHSTPQVSCSTGQALVSTTTGQALHTPGVLQYRTSTGVQVRHYTHQVSCSTGQALVSRSGTTHTRCPAVQDKHWCPGQALHTPGALQYRTSTGVHYGRSGTTHPRCPAVQDKHWCPLRQVRHYTHQVSCTAGQALCTRFPALQVKHWLSYAALKGKHSAGQTLHTRSPSMCCVMRVVTNSGNPSVAGADTEGGPSPWLKSPPLFGTKSLILKKNPVYRSQGVESVGGVCHSFRLCFVTVRMYIACHLSPSNMLCEV